MVFSALSVPPFRTIKLRERKPTCAACGVDGQRLGAIHETDYVAFCGGPRPDWEARGLVAGNPGHRLSAQVKFFNFTLPGKFSTVSQELHKRLESQEQCVLLDVRPKTEFGICHLPGSLSKVNCITLVAWFTNATQVFRYHSCSRILLPMYHPMSLPRLWSCVDLGMIRRLQQKHFAN